MRAAVLTVVALMLVVTAPATAQETTATAVVCTEVVDRAPVGAAETFPTDVGTLFCFSDVREASGSVVHAWFHDGNEAFNIELPARGPRWRTWSEKQIPSERTGAWRVEVRDPDGHVLATASFTVE